LKEQEAVQDTVEKEEEPADNPEEEEGKTELKEDMEKLKERTEEEKKQDEEDEDLMEGFTRTKSSFMHIGGEEGGGTQFKRMATDTRPQTFKRQITSQKATALKRGKTGGYGSTSENKSKSVILEEDYETSNTKSKVKQEI